MRIALKTILFFILISCCNLRLLYAEMTNIKIATIKVSNNSTLKISDFSNLRKTLILNDIAVIEAEDPSFYGKLQRLQKISLGQIPELGSEKLFKGEDILLAINNAGFSTDEINYLIPRTISIKITGRILTKEDFKSEANKAIQNYATSIQDREITFKDLQIAAMQLMVDENATLEVIQMNKLDNGRFQMNFAVKPTGQIKDIFSGIAMIDEWADLPVAKHDINLNSTITQSDIFVTRTNITNQTNLAKKAEEVIGKKTKIDIAIGKPFKKNTLWTPPIISKGRRVTISYKNGSLFATATGIAVEDGFKGEPILVKNEESQKVIKGKVQNEFIVQVND